MVLDRVARVAHVVANPPRWFTFGMWINGLLLLGGAQLVRSHVEVALGLFFIAAAISLSVAFHSDRALFSFIGFGIAASATGARCFAGFFISDSLSGSIIIIVAWFIISYTAWRRACLSFLAVYHADK